MEIQEGVEGYGNPSGNFKMPPREGTIFSTVDENGEPITPRHITRSHSLQR